MSLAKGRSGPQREDNIACDDKVMTGTSAPVFNARHSERQYRVSQRAVLISHTMPRWIFSLFQFFPLSLFAAYAFWSDLPTNERWIEAFQLSAIAGMIQLVIVFLQRFPMNRLVLAGNIYLILGGLAALTEQWWYLQLYDDLRESAIFLAMLLVGIVATFTTRHGFIGAPDADLQWTRHYSMLLLAATAICFIPALAFEGNRVWSAIVPIIALAVLQRYFSHLVSRKSHATIGKQKPQPDAG